MLNYAIGRVFVVGIRNDLEIKKDFEYPKPVNLKFHLQDTD